ncbi:MAG: hypothetical protein E6J14_04790 [Chloroflexi bacterium]|nr:MAG: hypothetical protein E6J14_04790 [Chloroflexota bacterium]
MTELLAIPVAVRTTPDGALAAVRLDRRWLAVERTLSRWLIETDWWRAAVGRDVRRCLLAGGECVELEHDRGGWRLVRRYD